MSPYRPAPERPFMRRGTASPRRDARLFLVAAALATLGALVFAGLSMFARGIAMPLPPGPIAVLFAATLVAFFAVRPICGRWPHPATCGIVAIAGILCFLPGCVSMGGAKTTSNAAKDALDAAQPIVHERCTKPALEAVARVQAMEPGHARETAARRAKADIDAKHCPEMWGAYDDLRVARVALIAVIAATEAGQCAGVSRAAASCNTAGAIVDVVKASSAVASAIKNAR